ncbi:PREDICTED: pentatricopeptide repeat-containing protein At4g18975, chloroplastic isoform X2 [Lupinus angustifolius]|uniref:pentatricopeptide repeat-containing protein At4g18975, chloroplastic isoform X2 n=1 Tax=Lupinus angustifolius TaxID=3871 RepID=UPI00092EB916|nr:PREDICTED: pentatricopeptide repeat-containing protein At4g18975, chloroplastic isoform X2 [Lupinus angustifolius]
MWRLPRFSYLVNRLNQVRAINLGVKVNHACYSELSTPQSHLNPSHSQIKGNTPGETAKNYIGQNVSRKDKTKYLINTLFDLNDSKEAIYGALDAWVAWEQNFPIASLKRILTVLEKEQQWHRVVQVIKWMLSKGQGTTMGTYGQLIRALDMDHRVGEAHKFWDMKVGTDLHSVPWQLCHLMISVYYRNNMLEDLVRLFKGLEAFDRKPRDKAIIQKVANAYEMLGLLQEKEKVLDKYSYVFTEEGLGKKNSRKSSKSKKIPLVTKKEEYKESGESSSEEQ